MITTIFPVNLCTNGREEEEVICLYSSINHDTPFHPQVAHFV